MRNHSQREAVILCATIVVLLSWSVTAGADSQSLSPATTASVDSFLSGLREQNPTLYGRHAGYVKYLGGDASRETALTDTLASLAKGRDVLEMQRGAFTWAVLASSDNRAHPVTLWFPPTYQCKDLYPLVVRLYADDPAGGSAPHSPNRADRIAIFVHGCDFRSGLGPVASDLIEAVTWATANLNVDDRRVYLDAGGTSARGALFLAALRPDLFAGAILRDPDVCDRIPANLQGFPVALTYATVRPDRSPASVETLRQQLARTGAIVDLFGVPQATLSQARASESLRSIDAWLSSRRFRAGGREENSLDNDPLYGLYDGRPLCVVVPTGGTDAYRAAISDMASSIAKGTILADDSSPKAPPISATNIPILGDRQIIGEAVRAHWILLGSPDTNSALAEQLAWSPVRIDGRWIELREISKRYPADQYGLVLARTNVRDAHWRVLVVCSNQARFFTTYSSRSFVPNASAPMVRRRPDLTILQAYTPAVAGLWFTDPLGRLQPSSDPRRIPAIVSTHEQLDRLKAEAARMATDSDVSFSATDADKARLTVIDGDELDLAGLLELVGNEPVITLDVRADDLRAAIGEAERNSTVTVRSPDLRLDGKAHSTFRVAVPLRQMGEVSRLVPVLKDARNLHLAGETLRDGIIRLFGRRGDLNRDDRIDAQDLRLFRRCFTGYGGPVSIGCRLADLDGDGTIDTRDLDAMRRDWDGPDLQQAVVESLMTAEDLVDTLSNNEQ